MEVNGWRKKRKEEGETKVERSLNNSWRRNKRVWRNRYMEKGRNIIKLPWRRYIPSASGRWKKKRMRGTVNKNGFRSNLKDWNTLDYFIIGEQIELTDSPLIKFVSSFTCCTYRRRCYRTWNRFITWRSVRKAFNLKKKN